MITRTSWGERISNKGSGPERIKKLTDIINVDLYAFNEVDMIADVTDLPLEDGSVELILNQAMLEHVTRPEVVVREMHRLLQPGGEVFCYLPFIQPFHAAPDVFLSVDDARGAASIPALRLYRGGRWCRPNFRHAMDHTGMVRHFVFLRQSTSA